MPIKNAVFHLAPLKTIARVMLLVVAVAFGQTLLADDATTPSPDTLKLKDGSVLFGKLLSGDSGVIHFESQHAGTLSIPINNVAELTSEQVAVFKFHDGRLIRLPRVTLTHELLAINTKDGVMSYSLADIDAINPESWMLGDSYHWTGNVRLALELQSGNTDKQEWDLDFESVWRRANFRYTLRGNGELDFANDVKTSDDYTLTGKSDRFLSDTTYAGANLYFEADEFAQLKSRAVLSAYYGKQWRSAPRFRFSTEPGLGFVSEKRTATDKEQYLAFSWSMDMNSNILGPKTDTYLHQVGLWNFEDTSDIVINTHIGVRMPVRSMVTVNALLKLEYDAGSPADVEDMDETFTIVFGYRW